MESSQPISASVIGSTTLESGLQCPLSPDCEQYPPPPPPPQSDTEAATVDTNLLREHLLQSLELKGTDENQNLGSQNLILKLSHDTQNLHLEEGHDVEARSFDVKETTHEGREIDLEETIDDEIFDLVETHLESESEGCKVGSDCDVLKHDGSESGKKGHPYPLRPDAEDCAYYMRTRTCKFGSCCKFNHPLRLRSSQAPKEKVKERGEESAEKPGQTECKYYTRTGGCKFGIACRYNHQRGKFSVAPILELNFLGLPIRPGEKECPFYMRTGSCKYGTNCRFNHPDPTSTGGSNPSGHAPPSTITSWSSPKPSKETPPFLPNMFQPNQGVSSQTLEWNGYQYSVPKHDDHPAYAMSSPTETNVYTYNQQQMLPERPGQPECNYYLETGDCKFKSNCKYHHPKTQLMRSPPCPLSDTGLPLRPDQNICTNYSRYGICKFGPACKFDHPVHYHGSAMTGFDQPSSYGAGIGGRGGDAAIQQHV